MSKQHLKKKFKYEPKELDIDFDTAGPDMDESFNMRHSFVNRRAVRQSLKRIDDQQTEGEDLDRAATPINLAIEDIQNKESGQNSHAFSEQNNMNTREPDLSTFVYGKTLDFKKDAQSKRQKYNNTGQKSEKSLMRVSAMANIMFNEQK